MPSALYRDRDTGQIVSGGYLGTRPHNTDYIRDSGIYGEWLVQETSGHVIISAMQEYNPYTGTYDHTYSVATIFHNLDTPNNPWEVVITDPNDGPDIPVATFPTLGNAIAFLASIMPYLRPNMF